MRDELQSEQRNQQRRDVHPELREVERREEDALHQQSTRQAERGGGGTEKQEQCRAEDEVHFGDADRVVREDLEEHEDQCGGRDRAKQ